MSVRGHHKRRSLTVNTDLKLMPLMNIIISLIPMLLLSAVFIEVKVIETSLPRDAGAGPAAAGAPARPPRPPPPPPPPARAGRGRRACSAAEAPGSVPLWSAPARAPRAPDSATARDQQ